jgi:hypothetical protein
MAARLLPLAALGRVGTEESLSVSAVDRRDDDYVVVRLV